MKFMDALDEVVWHRILRTQTPKERMLASFNRRISRAYAASE